VEQHGVARAAGAAVHVRTLAYCGEGGSVSYSVVGPGGRFCDNVGRAHRSNFVYFVVDFCNGVFCHKCHDPECAGFRSPWLPLPVDVWGQQEAEQELLLLQGS
jgi:hypothetical protein